MGARKICYSILVLILIASCNNTGNNTNSDAYTSRIETIRAEKDKEVLTEGIIEDEAIANFKGLHYFTVDTNFRVSASIKMADMSKVTFGTTKSEKQTYFKYCYLTFKIGDSTATLTAYAFDSAKVDFLFIPFRDQTSGKESYGGGRYIEMPYNGEKDKLTIDFNLAFNPYCHYNKNYTCPLVPNDNTINVAINAGEKKFHD